MGSGLMRLLFLMDKKDYDEDDNLFVRPSSRGIIIKDKKVGMVYSRRFNYYKFSGEFCQ